MSASSWLVSSLLGGTAVFAVGWTCALAARRHAAWENAIWRATLLLALALPVTFALAPRIPTLGQNWLTQVCWSDASRWFGRWGATAPAVLALDKPIFEPEMATFDDLDDPPKIGAPTPRKHVAPGNFLLSILLWVWGVGAAASLSGLMLGVRRVRRLARGARSLAPEEGQSLLADCARTARVRCPALRAADGLASPLLVGWRRPCILVPAQGGAPSREVLLHELAHLRRADLWWLTLGRLVSAIWWFHPLTWRLGRRLERSAEDVCDDLVVLWTQDAPGYAAQLVNFARAAQAQRCFAVAGAAITGFRSGLGKRVARMLDPRRAPRVSIGRGGMAFLTAGAALTLAFAAAVRPSLGQNEQPASAQPSTSPAPAASATPAPQNTPKEYRSAEEIQYDKDIAEMDRHLQSIILPDTEFKETPFREALERLREEARKHDPTENPENRGINIFIKLTRKPTPAPAASPGLNAPPSASPSVAAEPEDPPITLHLAQQPLLELLRAIASQVKMQVKVEQYAVSFVPLDETIDRLYTAEYAVALENLGQPAPGARVTRVDIKSWLVEKGIAFPPGASATYLSSKRLIIRNTRENIQQFEALFPMAERRPFVPAQRKAAPAEPAAEKKPAPETPAAATVNGVSIPVRKVRDLLGPRQNQLSKSYSGEELKKQWAEAWREAIHDLVDRELILQEFSHNKFNIPETIIDERIASIVEEEFDGEYVSFLATLEQQGFTEKMFRDAERDKIIVQAMRYKFVKVTKDITDPKENTRERQRLQEVWLKGLREKADVRVLIDSPPPA